MHKNISALQPCSLFYNIHPDSYEEVMKCLESEIKKYNKNEYIYHMEDKAQAIGIILAGSANIIQEDFWGNRTILSHIEQGEMFAEAFACAELPHMPVNVVAAEHCDIMFIHFQKVIHLVDSSGNFHKELIFNMIRILAQKNIILTRKMEHITRKTTRDKLLSYFSACAMQSQSNTFEIPYNRQELADYLSVDRSAMSNELSKLQKANLIQFHKNKFRLLQ